MYDEKEIQVSIIRMNKMITSIKNEHVKLLRKLQKKKYRNERQAFLIEGFHLVEEAWKSNWEIEEVIVQEGVELPEWCRDFPYEIVSGTVFQHISQTISPQGVAAVIKMGKSDPGVGDLLLLLDSIQDPGNLGTMIRTADAAGFDGIILGNDTVDLFNDKVIRATQGSLFHIPVVQSDLMTEVTRLKQNGYDVWATALDNAKAYTETAAADKVALIVGNEGAGVNNELLKMADKIVNIPIYGKAESLNVSIAAGILMYHIKVASTK